jgi:hypothetical protein
MSTTENQYSTAPDGSVLCLECGAVLVNVKNILRHLESDACRARHAAMGDRIIVEYSKTCIGTAWEPLIGTPVADLLPSLQEKKESFADSLRPHEPEEEELEQDPFPERGSYEELEAVIPEPTVQELEAMGETTFVALTDADVKRAERLDLPIEYLPRHDELAALPDSPVPPVEKVVHHSEVSGAPLKHHKQSGAPLPATSKLIAKPRRWKGNLPQACAWLAQQLDLRPADLLTLGQRQYRPVGARGLWAALGDKQGRAAVTAKLAQIMPQVVAYYDAAMGTIETRCDGGTIRARWVEYSCNVCGKTSERHDSRPAATPRTCYRCSEKAEKEKRESAGKQDWRWVEIRCPFCGGLEVYYDDLPLVALRRCNLCEDHVKTRAREMTEAEVIASRCGPETRCDGGRA